jgi:hypothetical protein
VILKTFLFISFYSFISVCVFAGDPDGGSGGGSGGPSIQKEEAVIETIDLSKYPAFEKLMAASRVTAEDARVTRQIMNLTKNVFAEKPKQQKTTFPNLKEAESIDELISMIGQIKLEEKKPIQYILPVRIIEGMRIGGKYFNVSEFKGTKEVLIDNSQDYEVYFNSGNVLDITKPKL